jgi:hypothetical protein
MTERLDQLWQSEQRRTKKIEQLVSLLKDPEVADFVAKLQGDGSFAPSAAGAIASANSNSNGHKLPDSITAALKAIGPRLSTAFTIKDAVDALAAAGYEFHRAPVEEVRDSLYWRCRAKTPDFAVVETGRGGRMSTYRYLQRGS